MKTATNSWETKLLHEVADIIDCPHSTPKWIEEGVFVIRNWNVRNGRLILDKQSFTDETTYIDRIKRAKPEPGDIVLTREAPMGELCMIPAGLKCCLGQRVVLLKPKSVVNKRYLFYTLLSSNAQNQIKSSEGTGSTVSNLRIPDIAKIKLSIPKDISVQDRIASILTSLDDKIELNLQMNKTLEAIAQAIFKEWIIDFRFPGFEGVLVNGLPRGWRKGEIKDICSNVRCSYYPDKTKLDLRYVGLEHVPRQSTTLVNWGHSSDIDSQKSKFMKGDVLFGKLRPYFHKVVIAPFDGICSTDIMVVRARCNHMQSFSLMHLSSDACIKYATSQSNGTRMPRVSWDSLSKYPIVIPPDATMVRFQDIVNSLIERSLANIIENSTLIEIRNNLLPKLMNGKIRVG